MTEAARQKRIATSKEWRLANPEKNREQSAKWRKANPEKTKAIYKKWRDANIEQERLRVKVWFKDNPEAIKAIKRKSHRTRRRLLWKASGSHTNGEWETLKAQYDWRCLACNRQEPEIKLSEDHIVPLSKGGSDNIVGTD